MIDEELRLVENCQAGDGDSFNQLVLIHQQRIYTMCFRMLGDADAGADATQDTFIAAFCKIHMFRGGSFRSWITRIAANICYDILRKRKRRPTLSLNSPPNVGMQDDEPAVRELADPNESPDDIVLRHEFGEAIQKMLDLLQEDQRLVVILSDIQGLSYQEIADITGTTLGTVKSRLSRGRSRLRLLLKDWELLPPRFRYPNEDV